MEELNCKTVLKLPVLGGISESVVVTWIIMAVLVLLSIILVRNLKVENPGKVQLALESIIGWAQDFFEGIIGKENKAYVPYLITVLLYLAVSNTIGLLGFKPPTKDLNVTAALAIMSMCVIEFSGIHKNGVVHWMKHFAKPVPVVAPITILEIVIRPLSLLYAAFRKYAGGICSAGTFEIFCAAYLPDPRKFLF